MCPVTEHPSPCQPHCMLRRPQACSAPILTDSKEGEHLDRHTRLTGRYSRALGDVRKCHPDSQEGGETVAVGA